ncbi:hypothetical protein HK102_011867, partial [Quaeritorhiza haematococci]
PCRRPRSRARPGPGCRGCPGGCETRPRGRSRGWRGSRPGRRRYSANSPARRSPARSSRSPAGSGSGDGRSPSARPGAGAGGPGLADGRRGDGAGARRAGRRRQPGHDAAADAPGAARGLGPGRLRPRAATPRPGRGDRREGDGTPARGRPRPSPGPRSIGPRRGRRSRPLRPARNDLVPGPRGGQAPLRREADGDHRRRLRPADRRIRPGSGRRRPRRLPAPVQPEISRGRQPDPKRRARPPDRGSRLLDQQQRAAHRPRRLARRPPTIGRLHGRAGRPHLGRAQLDPRRAARSGRRLGTAGPLLAGTPHARRDRPLRRGAGLGRRLPRLVRSELRRPGRRELHRLAPARPGAGRRLRLRLGHADLSRPRSSPTIHPTGDAERHQAGARGLRRGGPIRVAPGPAGHAPGRPLRHAHRAARAQGRRRGPHRD